MIRIMPGVDITQPADPELADYLDAKYGPENGRRKCSRSCGTRYAALWIYEKTPIAQTAR